MSPPPCNGTTFFRRCLLGAFLSKILTKIKVLDGTLRYCVARSQRPTTTTSILRPIRSQFYVQFDLNYTSNSTSIIRPIRSQLPVQFDLNYTSNSTSIIPPYRVTTFFCRRYGAGGTWNSNLRQRLIPS